MIEVLRNGPQDDEDEDDEDDDPAARVEERELKRVAGDMHG